jgi:hypothetical protein
VAVEDQRVCFEDAQFGEFGQRWAEGEILVDFVEVPCLVGHKRVGGFEEVEVLEFILQVRDRGPEFAVEDGASFVAAADGKLAEIGG